MELQGIVHDGVIVPEDGQALAEGMRVRIFVESHENSQSFGQRYAAFKGILKDLPADLAAQHDHYRLIIRVNASDCQLT